MLQMNFFCQQQQKQELDMIYLCWKNEVSMSSFLEISCPQGYFINRSVTFKSRSKLPIFHLAQDLDMTWFDLFDFINVPAAHVGYIWTDRNLLLRHSAQLFMKSSWGSFVCIIIITHFCLSTCQLTMSTASWHISRHRHRIKQLCSDCVLCSVHGALWGSCTTKRLSRVKLLVCSCVLHWTLTCRRTCSNFTALLVHFLSYLAVNADLVYVCYIN